MKWKGRRVSKNIEDQRDNDAIRSIIENSTVEYTGLPPTKSTPKGDRVKLPDRMPAPKSKPSQKKGRVINTQVTPGVWKTN